ncbi:ABC transporter ATP-binding protein [Cohnella sp. REN36]|uniref:ABC transporter ATP-binding protein n=1 Tax=Cohnella sp. REN36 TaxID=2887347 RepID=UPI001D13728A|nr:ABC transporter ATP-binding protein [Cohnella sp. REN36]MCC3373303.1 ABC transporter ATP-binding protein [Cohnella sp. REN36]
MEQAQEREGRPSRRQAFQPGRPSGKTQGDVVLSVERVSKSIGRKPIIRDISFDVRAGEIFGFLGPNGSGKTTTIRMLVDLIKPTGGRISVCGEDVNRSPERALRHVGCIVENPEMYSYMTGWENLAHFARMQPDIPEARIEEVVDIVGLDARIHDKVKTYSLGMRQRLGIAQALLGSPKLLILDEPTNGLDPKGIKELRAFIRELADGGMSVFVSSHLLSEIQLMCDRVAIIGQGRVIAVGKVEELVAQAETYTLWLVSDPERAEALLREHPDARVVGEDEHRIDESLLAAMPGAIVTSMEPDAVPGWVERFVAAGIGVQAVHRASPSLEELFLKLTEGERLG